VSVRAMRYAFVVFVLTGIGLIVAGFVLYRYAAGYPDRPTEAPGRAVTVTIPRGANFTKVVTLLKARGLIRSETAFRIYANYKGQASKCRAGTYRLNTNINPRRLLATLVHGVPSPTISVTIPEGKNMLQVAEILAKARVSSKERLVAAMRDVRFLRRIGVPSHTAEGYLFPDTYRMKVNSNAETVIEKLYRRHKSVYVRLRRKHAKYLFWLRERLGWGHKEVVTMASIVEKETGRGFERPLIAGVFINRLTFRFFRPKLLQTDPTIIYGCTVPEVKSAACERFKGRIRRIHLDDKDNPYNTYTHNGLPPGPISNPGRAAIEAVLSPKKSRYLYFVSKNDGTHYFSATRAQHERAVDKYQRGGKPRGKRTPEKKTANDG
jgi:UPF0755 protein